MLTSIVKWLCIWLWLSFQPKISQKYKKYIKKSEKKIEKYKTIWKGVVSVRIVRIVISPILYLTIFLWISYWYALYDFPMLSLFKFLEFLLNFLKKIIKSILQFWCLCCFPSHKDFREYVYNPLWYCIYFSW